MSKIEIGLWKTIMIKCCVCNLHRLFSKLWIRENDSVAYVGDTSIMTLNNQFTFRKWRRTTCFKQKEIARLLGLTTKSQVSRLEQGRGSLGLKMAISLEVLSGMPLQDLLPDLYDIVEEETVARVTLMLDEIGTSLSVAAKQKCVHLKQCQDRAITRISKRK